MSFYAKTLLGLFIFWIIYTIGISAMLSDIAESAIDREGYTYPNTTSFNVSVDGINSNNPTPWGLWGAMNKMLTFRLSSDGMPWMIGIIISGFNWMIVLFMLLCIYRVLLPTA